MTEHEGSETTAELAGAILRKSRERRAAEAAEGAASPVTGADIETLADALADGAARLAEMLAAFTAQPRRSLDAIAVFRGLSGAAGSIAGAAAELQRQEWFDLDDADDEARAAWDAALAGLRAAEGTFTWAADGWI